MISFHARALGRACGLARAAGLAAALLAPGAAHAHQIWIEQDAKGARLYFGEFAENMREVSPGKLDELTATRARLVDARGERPLELVKAANAFTLSGKAGPGEALVVEETGYPAFDSEEGGKKLRTIWTPAARYLTGFATQSPRLTLDIVPTGKPGELQVIYRGKPLAGAEVAIAAASGWGKEAETDEQGKVSFSLPWKGGYLVSVHHTDKTPGTRAGKGGPEKYDAASFVTTAALVARVGLAAPPAPPPAKPSPPGP